ncbi:hypothetical protein [Amycolatopsis australiensis]|uniref:hypothetical protein n=1 Tax=Amycolatopsis australiensis TaxID=546364 RepID=UPI0011612E88|nr:hypothetical protein [Amycolatopsis australiensis]
MHQHHRHGHPEAERGRDDQLVGGVSEGSFGADAFGGGQHDRQYNKGVIGQPPGRGRGDHHEQGPGAGRQARRGNKAAGVQDGSAVAEAITKVLAE